MHRLSLLLALVGLLALSTPSQMPNPWPPRTHYVFHVYVDPTFGDDSRALAANPAWGGTPGPLTRHPDTSAIPAGDIAADPALGQYIGGVLTQAPFSFRTVNAAIQYVCTAGPTLNSGWLLGAQQGNAYIKWIVIHLLPGIYRASSQPTIDPACGLPWNGEVFPIEVPYGISLQGTSALDTIIDATPPSGVVPTHAIKILHPGQASVFAPNGRGWLAPQGFQRLIEDSRTFIDSLTIRGATLSAANAQAPPFRDGAGVFMKRDSGLPGYAHSQEAEPWLNIPPLRVTISNCFINHCGIGVAVVAAVDVFIYTWEPIIINNTFADNVFVNVYNGSWGTSTRVPPILSAPAGLNTLRVTNNIFLDTAQGLGVFAGMHEADMRVIRGSQHTIFNAYRSPSPPIIPNLPPGYPGWGTVPEWPNPPVRTVNPGPPASPPLPPVVNTANFSNANFFVNSMFIASGNPRSPHDYRLAPFTNMVTSPPLDPTGMPNPMVNRGVTLDLTMSPPEIKFASTTPPNGNPVVNMKIDNNAEATGLQIAASDAYTSAQHPAGMELEPWQVFDSWDCDCNGFANARIYARPGFADGGFGNIDLGAHELGDLLMSGYLNDTRMYARGAPGTVPVRDRIYFFNTPGGTYPRPDFNLVFGGYDWQGNGGNLDWFLNAQTNPTAPLFALGSNYTQGDVPAPNTLTWRLLMGPFFQNQKQGLLVMRNLECDFSPHLACDIHPLWAMFGQTTITDPCLPTPPNTWIGWDMFASNGWYRDFGPSPSGNYSHQRQPSALGDPPPGPCDMRIFIDNPFVYYNPSPSWGWTVTGPPLVNQSPAFPSNVTSGLLNPPGTYLAMMVGGDPNTGVPRLMVESFPLLGVFGPWSPCVNTAATTYTVDGFGIGDNSTGCPDQIPFLFFANGCGLRINCMNGVDVATGIGMSNLQTFLMYVNQPPQDVAAMMASPSLQRPEVQRTRPTAASLQRMRNGLRLRLQPPTRR